MIKKLIIQSTSLLSKFAFGHYFLYYLYNEIITKANPKMFIEPYQPNKLTTANEIYSEALKNKHNRDVLKKLLDRIKKEL